MPQVCARRAVLFADLLMQFGRNEKVLAFTEEVTTNCARKQERSDVDPCGAVCPDLPNVL